MLPKISLLEELRKGGYEASLITTFNAYLPFYEEVVLRRLVNAGVRHNVLLMDAQQYSASFASHPPKFAGRRYTLIPVRAPGAFHPKLIVLIGKHKGLLVIGSHNMTLAGFGFNRELTNVVRIQETDGTGIDLVHDVWTEIDHWLSHLTGTVPNHVVEMARRVRDIAPWMSRERSPARDTRLLAGRPGHTPLWAQLLQWVDGPVTEAVISGAFFDEHLRFLEAVKRDVRPTRLIVGVDPQTVAMPPKARSHEGISLVKTHSFGVDDDKDDVAPGYLHAKGILLKLAGGDVIFVTGSANPSGPAWLATASTGNVELMLARRGTSARAAAEAVGFTALAEMAPLNDEDWQAIARNHEERVDPALPAHAVGVAVVDDGLLIIDPTLLARLKHPEFILLTANREEIARSRSMRSDQRGVLIDFPAEQLDQGGLLHCAVNGSLQLELLLHHARAIEDQSRTGVQRRFKEALLSLETDTPNIGLLIECIDKIVFSDSTTVASAGLARTASRDEADTQEPKELGSLAVDLRDVQRRTKKNRLHHSADFAYLLDALIYHLRIEEDKSLDELDRYGRSEEEQVGADDDEATEAAQHSEEQQRQLIELCHSKVRTLVNRMASQFRSYTEGKQPLDAILVRLLGVLAVLRELRACDGRVAWVEKGTTTVPDELRLRLLEDCMLTLFEGESSLLRLERLGDEFQHSDDVARLKGLILWLAWDCGLELDLRKPFMESAEQLADRLKQNAMVLALAQMIGTDEVATDEARQSIGSLTATEMDWLRDVQRIATLCDAARRGEVGLRPANAAETGDVATHKTLKHLALRIVAANHGKNVSLIRLNKQKDRVTYTADHLNVTKLSPRPDE